MLVKILKDKIKDYWFQRASASYWKIAYGVNMAVYFANSIGQHATYCNVLVYDLLDTAVTAVWHVDVQIGESYRKRFPMGGAVNAFDFDLTPAMPNRNVNNILKAPIVEVWTNCIHAARKGIIRELTMEQAQKRANKGIPAMIISEPVRHVAITAPNMEWDGFNWVMRKYDKHRGCFTGNAGLINDMMYMSDTRGFGNYDWQNPKVVKIFEFQRRQGGFYA